MKIYHTETQADYDALMVELEGKGFKWAGGSEMLQFDIWNSSENLTSIRVYGSEVNHASLNYYKEEYPHIPIVKYKAKAEEKMKFTKENVLKLTNEWIEHKIGGSLDLQNAIMDLDDTRKKAVVPKYVAEYIERHKKSGADLQTMLISYRRFYDNTNSHSDVYGKEAVQWYVDNPYKFIQAYEKGYTIEPEQLYYIPLPDLEMLDGIQQVLTKRSKNGRHYFASRPNDKLKQRYTKAELEQVPEVYKPYATLIEEEEK